MYLSLKYVLLAIAAFSFGSLASAGVFTVLVAVGIIPRFAGKTHTGDKVILYENMVVLGTIVGCVFSIFERYLQVGNALMNLGIGKQWIYLAGNAVMIIFGVLAGMFIGCLALAIAEMLDSIPILARRISFRHGLGIAVTAIAIGKFAGSLFYFLFRLYEGNHQ